MTQIFSTSRQTVEAFFTALERHDLAALEPLLDPAVVEVIPFSLSGAQEPEAVFRGKDAVLGYLGTIVANFSRAVLTERRFTVAEDGATVFLEAKGDLVHAHTSAPYRNMYVFRFDLHDGRIVGIAEYANPVPFARLVGLPLGAS